MYCLNLPPDLRYKPENICVIGVTPPPNSPTHETLCHLLNPVLSTLVKYGIAPGEKVPTFYHQDGISIQVKVAPLMADSPARVEAG